MCSLAGEVMLKEKNNFYKNGTVIEKCKKCLTGKPSVLLRKNDPYCKSCFLQATVHKFRATLGKYRITNNERVLIIYRTGHPTSALLHFIKSGLEQLHHKKLRLVPIILYIDDHYRLTADERLEIYKNVSKEIISHNFVGYFTILDKLIENLNESPEYIEITNNGNNEKVRNLLDSIEKNIEVLKNDDIVNISRRRLIINSGKVLKCKYAFTTDITVDVAVKMLGNVALGRGSHLSLDVGAFDDRDSDVNIIQPLRYFDMKELAFYNIFNNISPVNIPIQNDKRSHLSKINVLLTKFVCDLQENYPSTVNTVVRTGDKLKCHKSELICRICKAPVEVQDQLSSDEASQFSHWVSVNACTLQEHDISSFINNSDKSLCYGCDKISNLLDK